MIGAMVKLIEIYYLNTSNVILQFDAPIAVTKQDKNLNTSNVILQSERIAIKNVSLEFKYI